MAQKKPVVLLRLPNGTTLDSTNYASCAERSMAAEGRGGVNFPKLTMTKLRGIYGLIMNVYTRINVPEDFEKYKSEIQYLKVKMAYEAGRELSVKDFLDKTFLMHALDYVTSYDKFVLYCRYAESLVAYFKFYGGKD